MRFGNKNEENVDPYVMYESTSSKFHCLEESIQERDLGIQVKTDLKWDAQCQYAAARANLALATIKRAFTVSDVATISNLYKVYVRPHLEYAVQAWSPYLEKDIKCLERVQRRATKIPHQTRHLEYNDRLRAFRLTSLKERRKRGDLIQMYKFVNGFNNVTWFHPNRGANSLSQHGPAGGLRGGAHRIVKQITNCKAREHFFNNRVVNDWNKLSSQTVGATSVNKFKNCVDRL